MQKEQIISGISNIEYAKPWWLTAAENAAKKTILTLILLATACSSIATQDASGYVAGEAIKMIAKAGTIAEPTADGMNYYFAVNISGMDNPTNSEYPMRFIVNNETINVMIPPGTTGQMQVKGEPLPQDPTSHVAVSLEQYPESGHCIDQDPEDKLVSLLLCWP